MHRRNAIVLGLIVVAACKTNESPRTIAILKFATHPALDATEHGVRAILDSAITAGLARVRVESYNAEGNPPRAAELAQLLMRPDVKIIVAIATPAAQAVARIRSDIPIVYAAVADPDGAGVSSRRSTGIRNVDPSTVARAFAFIRACLPGVDTIGTIFNSSEQNSVYVQGLMRAVADSMGIVLVQRAVRDPSEVATAAQVLARQVDAVYSANDNTVNRTVAAVAAATQALRKPFFLGDLSTLSGGALAAIGLEYEGMGRDVGRIVLHVFRDGIAAEPPRPAPAPQIWLNETVRSRIAFTVPDSALRMVARTVRAPD